MKNDTKFTDGDILSVVAKLEMECSDSPLSVRQVLNIAAIVDNFKYDSSEDRLLALEYTSMIRSQMMFYVNHVVTPDKLVNYRHKQYLTIEGIAKRVIMAMYPERKFDLYKIDDKYLEMNTLMMLKDLQVEMLERKNIKKKTLKMKKDNK